MIEMLDKPDISEPRVSVRARRILMLSTAMGAGGGAEEQVIELAYGLKSRGCDVRIVSMLAPTAMPTDFKTHDIPLTHLGMRKSIPDPRGLWRFNQLLHEFRPDVVHTHLVHANLLGRLARITQPIPALVCTLHSLTMTGVKRDWSPIFEIAHRMTDLLCDRTTAICHAAADYAVRRRAVPAAKMTVIENGIDTRKFSPDPSLRTHLRRELGVESAFVWLAVGRLEIQKAYPVLLKAMSLLGDDRSTLLICGQRSLRAKLEAVAAELGVSARVRFLGLRNDIPAIMNAADGMVLSSDIEGLPLVLLQAAASALPIITTDVGGNGEAVFEGQSGWIVPPQAPESLATAMARLVAMPSAQRQSMGQHGRDKICELFDIERVVDRWIKLYDDLLKPS